MNDTIDQKIREPNTVEERIVWVLEQMIRSSKIRGDYFKHINDFNSQYITDNIEPDPKTGVPVENREIYDAIHADFIFRVAWFGVFRAGLHGCDWSTVGVGISGCVKPVVLRPVFPVGICPGISHFLWTGCVLLGASIRRSVTSGQESAIR